MQMVAGRRCVVSRELLKHHQKCTDQHCEVCTPVKNYVQKQRQMQLRQEQLRQRGLPSAMPYGAGAPPPGYTPAQIQAMQAGPPGHLPLLLRCYCRVSVVLHAWMHSWLPSAQDCRACHM